MEKQGNQGNTIITGVVVGGVIGGLFCLFTESVRNKKKQEVSLDYDWYYIENSPSIKEVMKKISIFKICNERLYQQIGDQLNQLIEISVLCASGEYCFNYTWAAYQIKKNIMENLIQLYNSAMVYQPDFSSYKKGIHFEDYGKRKEKLFGKSNPSLHVNELPNYADQLCAITNQLYTSIHKSQEIQSPQIFYEDVDEPQEPEPILKTVTGLLSGIMGNFKNGSKNQ